MLTGENGIIKKAQEAKSNTEYAEWSERIDLAILDAKANNNNNEDINDVIQELKNKDIIDYENQVDLETGNITTNEPSYVVTDKLKDYISNVEITISKNPESEPSGGVLLRVEKVEGIEENIDLNTVDINALTEQVKKDMIKIMELFAANTFEGKNFTSFEEVLDLYGFEKEEEYWYYIQENQGGIDNCLNAIIQSFKEENVQSINNYVIINPDNKLSDIFVAFENKNYTFTIKEILTGKTYTKIVEVQNIDVNMLQYSVTGGDLVIYLLDNNILESTEFQQAYIIFNGEKIEITEFIKDSKEIDAWGVAEYLEELGKISDSYDINHTDQVFQLIKDGKSCFGIVNLLLPV